MIEGQGHTDSFQIVDGPIFTFRKELPVRVIGTFGPNKERTPYDEILFMHQPTMTLAPVTGPCVHEADGLSVDVASRRAGKSLRRHTCQVCRRRWWDWDGAVMEPSEARSGITHAFPSIAAVL